MKRLYLMILALLTLVGGVNAKTKTTTLWEETYTSAIELNSETVATFTAGNVLRIYVTVPSGGANFGLSYKSEGNSWIDTAIPSVNTMWPWVSDGDYYDVTLTDDDITALSGQNIYISKGDNSTITKVVLIGEVATTGETDLLDESWTASWTAKTFAAQSNAKIGDVIRFSYSAPGGWSYFQFNILDAYGNANAFENKSSNVGTSIETAADLYFEFEITNISDLKKIQNEGFGIKGDNFTLTSVQLLTYADSYDAVSITVGGDGVATYSNGGKNVQISACDALKAYYASAVAEGTVTLTELTGCIPANTGVMIYGAEGTYTVPVGGEGWPSITTNYLKPTGDSSAEVAASTDGTYHYIFAKDKDENIGFFKLTSDYNLAAHRAYLETTEDITPVSDARLVLRFEDEDDPTAIGEVKSAVQPVKADNVYYNLNGQRVEKPTKGIYILNGKKVLF